MTLREFLRTQEWVVYKVDTTEGTYFGDTGFGPMMKKLPEDVVVDEPVKLDSMSEVEEYMGIRPVLEEFRPR